MCTRLYLKLRDFVGAEKCFRQAVYFDPAESLSFINLGAALAYQSKWAEAIEACSEAKILDPAFPGLDDQLVLFRQKLRLSRER